MEEKIKISNWLIFVIFGVFVLANLNGLKICYDYFKTQDESVITRKVFIKQDDAKVLMYHKQATDYMAKESHKVNKIACFYSGAVYERTYEYLFDIYYPEIKYDRTSKSFEDKASCKYYSVITKDSEKLIGNSYKDYFDFIDSKIFGRLEVWNVIAKDGFINYDKEEEELKEKEEAQLKEKTDKDIQKEFKKSLESSIRVYLEEDEEEEAEKPDRVERVLWKHVFNGTLPEE